jgi:hypothetical protein
MALNLLINGKPVTEPTEWKDIQFKAAYGTNSNQPSIESDRFTLVLDACREVLNHVNSGKIFEELPVEMSFDNYQLFEGFVDTSEELEFIEPSFGANNEEPIQVSAKFKKDDAIQYFVEKLNGVSYGSLLEDGTITESDFATIDTIVRKRANFLEVAITIVTIYLLKKQIQDTIRKTIESIQDVIAIATGGITGGIAAAVYSIALAILQVAYSVVLLALLTNLVTQIIFLLVPPRVKNKGMSFKKLLSKACEKFGYTLQTNITDLDLYHYLPSKPYQNSEHIEQKVVDFFLPVNRPNKVGIPSTSDYGYLLNEFFDLCTKMFNARTDVVGDTVFFYNADDEFWFSQSTFTPPINLKFDSKRFNTEDLPQTRMLSFTTDVLDDWTIENYTGTAYEIKTETATGNLGTIKGLDRIDFPLCLPNSKTKRNGLEEIVYQMAKFADSLVKVLGQKSSFAADFDQAVNNKLLVASNSFNIPKVVPLQGRNVPANHREICSAKYLYEKYHFGKSFVLGEKLGQKVLYSNVSIPFNIDNLQETINNGSFILNDGRKARFVELTYLLGQDTAQADIEVQEVYTDRLKELYYEP